MFAAKQCAKRSKKKIVHPCLSKKYLRINKKMQRRPVLDDVARDIVAITAAVLTLLAFIFAVWATVATLRQQQNALEAEQRVLNKVERLEEQILHQLDQRAA